MSREVPPCLSPSPCLSPLPSPSRPHRKFKSDLAADKALKQISTIEILEQINLFETVLQLYSIGALTRLENEKLQNNYITELTRKSLLVTSIIPGKGCYRGMRYFRRALKKTGQCTLLYKLDRAYEDAVDKLIAENLDLLTELEEEEEVDGHVRSTSLSSGMEMTINLGVNHEATRRSSSFDSTASLEHQNGDVSPQLSPAHSPDILKRLCRRKAIRNNNGYLASKKKTSLDDNSSSEDENEVDSNGANVFVLDNAAGHTTIPNHTLEQSVGINIQFSLPPDCSNVTLPPIVLMTPDGAPSEPFSAFRDRSTHISHKVHPRRKHSADQSEPTAKSQSEDHVSSSSPQSYTEVQSDSFETDQFDPNGTLQDGEVSYILFCMKSL